MPPVQYILGFQSYTRASGVNNEKQDPGKIYLVSFIYPGFAAILIGRIRAYAYIIFCLVVVSGQAYNAKCVYKWLQGDIA